MTKPIKLELEAMDRLLLEHRRVLEWGHEFCRRIPGVDWTMIEPASAPRKGACPEPSTTLYLSMPDYHAVGRNAIGEFALIIVNGKLRAKCLFNARNLLSHNGVVVMRGATHPRYKPVRQLYSHSEELLPAQEGYGGLMLFSKPLPEKIFVVGLTGTAKHSVNAALKLMGYSYKHYPDPARVIEESEVYDCLNDTPVIQFIEILERLYPTAKFILTTRELRAWLIACKRHWARGYRMSKRQLWNRRSVYGMLTFNAALFTQIYERHSARVRAYFKDRPGKLLVLNVCDGEGYEKLCPFLGTPMVEGPFPHGSRSKSIRISK